MAGKEVVFTIAEDGTIEWESKGYKGKGCEAVAKALESIGPVTVHKNTDEFYKSPNPNSVSVGN